MLPRGCITLESELVVSLPALAPVCSGLMHYIVKVVHPKLAARYTWKLSYVLLGKLFGVGEKKHRRRRVPVHTPAVF